MTTRSYLSRVSGPCAEHCLVVSDGQQTNKGPISSRSARLRQGGFSLLLSGGVESDWSVQQHYTRLNLKPDRGLTRKGWNPITGVVKGSGLVDSTSNAQGESSVYLGRWSSRAGGFLFSLLEDGVDGHAVLRFAPVQVSNLGCLRVSRMDLWKHKHPGSRYQSRLFQQQFSLWHPLSGFAPQLVGEWSGQAVPLLLGGGVMNAQDIVPWIQAGSLEALQSEYAPSQIEPLLQCPVSAQQHSFQVASQRKQQRITGRFLGGGYNAHRASNPSGRRDAQQRPFSVIRPSAERSSTVPFNRRQKSSSAVNNRCGKFEHPTSAGESLGGRGAAGAFSSATDETSKTGLLITRKLPETPGLAWGECIPLSMPVRAKRSAQKDWIEQTKPVSA